MMSLNCVFVVFPGGIKMQQLALPSIPYPPNRSRDVKQHTDHTVLLLLMVYFDSDLLDCFYFYYQTNVIKCVVCVRACVLFRQHQKWFKLVMRDQRELSWREVKRHHPAYSQTDQSKVISSTKSLTTVACDYRLFWGKKTSTLHFGESTKIRVHRCVGCRYLLVDIGFI